MAERMFDGHSFTDEITDASEAQQAVEYLAKNETNFRSSLSAEGVDYEQIQSIVRHVWVNLLKSCHRVGFRNHVTDHKAAQYGRGVNLALPKD